MKKFKYYFKMKYEMFLMGLFDRIYKMLKGSRLHWYPNYVINRGVQDIWFDKWIQAEQEISEYNAIIWQKDEYIYYLEMELERLEKEAE